DGEGAGLVASVIGALIVLFVYGLIAKRRAP
ncbi:MAG: GlsB/YeaQ/YmgE family stress response membrane protein, partial [Rhizobacter sp.]